MGVITHSASGAEQRSGLVLHGTLMLPGASASVRLAPGCVATRGDRIEAIELGEAWADPTSGPSRALADRVGARGVGGEGALVLPGLIDAHVHLPQWDCVGVAGLELLDWLERVIFPAEARWNDVGHAAEMSRRVGRALLGVGTTGLAAYATSHGPSAQAAIETLAGLGMRGGVGHVLMDRHGPTELIRPAKESLEASARLVAMGLIEPIVTPRFAVSCSAGLMRGAAELAAARGWRAQTHLAETPRELAVVAELFGGVRYTRVYEQVGLLRPGTLLAHGIHLDAEDHAAIARAGSVVAHCPTANRFLDAGTMDRRGTLARGVGMALGSDVAGGPDRSMVRVARAMAEAALSRGDGVVPAGTCWWQITGGNAAALSWKDAGRLEVGCRADAVLAVPTGPWRDGPDPLGALLYGWDDRWIVGTLAGGHWHGSGRGA